MRGRRWDTQDGVPRQSPASYNEPLPTNNYPTNSAKTFQESPKFRPNPRPAIHLRHRTSVQMLIAFIEVGKLHAGKFEVRSWKFEWPDRGSRSPTGSLTSE